MSKKYIAQIENTNFIFPNNDLYEYDVEIIHDINNNFVSGNVTNLVAELVNSNTELTITFDYNWLLNGAEPQNLSNGHLSVMSIHLMTPDQQYFKPWILIDNISNSDNSQTNLSGSYSYTYNPGKTLPYGLYVLEFRFIAHRCIFPIVSNYNIPEPDCSLDGTAVS